VNFDLVDVWALDPLDLLLMGVVLALLAVVVLWAYLTANRLDRLHVRADSSWQALDAALDRRATVARVAAGALPAAQGKQLAALADRAESAPRAEREDAENALSAALAGIDCDALAPQLVVELADADARVLIARRFHNDAVRDTLAIRTRRPVRYLRLGGRAPLPQYFEISELSAPEPPVADEVRVSARVLLLDEGDRVLVIRASDPSEPGGAMFWFTVGGAVENEETPREAAVREAREETGVILSQRQLRGPAWRRLAVFRWNGELVHSEELFFAARVEHFEPSPIAWTELERRALAEFRWCSAEDLRALAAGGEKIYPLHLPDILEEAAAVADGAAEPEAKRLI
jgi:8-oxo-dGTP pyrophosphatase MutT (NUDIX family)